MQIISKSKSAKQINKSNLLINIKFVLRLKKNKLLAKLGKCLKYGIKVKLRYPQHPHAIPLKILLPL